jgi:glycosyltransferase involved in cell wall biosynthesis
MKVDILFLAHNRREYTEEALRQLVKNTNWGLVESLTMVDDCSTDNFPTMFRLMMSDAFVRKPGRVSKTSLGGPCAVMDWYLKSERPDWLLPTDNHWQPSAPWFAKIDNDTIVPPGWLDACVRIASTNITDLIGIEARYCEYQPMPAGNLSIIKFRPTDHVGGIGLFRRAVFEQYPLTALTAQEQAAYRVAGRDPWYYGFTEWQWAHPDVRKFWIDPPLPVFLLDHLPMEPWKSLGEEYVKKGWQRPSWGYYHPENDKGLWEWWLNSPTNPRTPHSA